MMCYRITKQSSVIFFSVCLPLSLSLFPYIYVHSQSHSHSHSNEISTMWSVDNLNKHNSTNKAHILYKKNRVENIEWNRVFQFSENVKSQEKKKARKKNSLCFTSFCIRNHVHRFFYSTAAILEIHFSFISAMHVVVVDVRFFL